MPAATAANLLLYALQVAAIVAVGAALPSLFRLTPPRARLGYYRALLVVCLALPVTPPLVTLVTFGPAGGPPGAQPAEQPADQFAVQMFDDVVVARVAGTAARFPAYLVPAIYLGGVACRLLWLAVGLAAVARLRRSAVPLDPLPRTVEWAVEHVGTSAEFRVSRTIAQPVSFGARRPVVLVPANFGDLDPAGQRALACHELVHLRRRDWVPTLIDEIVRAVLWFHPAIWWLLDRIHLAREQVVDREVVELTGSRRAYLDTLLALATARTLSVPRPASAFLRSAHLLERVALLLKETSMSRQRVLATFGAMAVILTAGASLAVQALPLQAGQAAPRPGVGAQTAPTPGMVPGKDIPKKIHDVRPVYPPEAKEKGIEGIVLVEATVDAKGIVTNARPVSSGNEALMKAAIEAVRQWRFEAPARAPVTFTVTVRFVLDRDKKELGPARLNPAAEYPDAARESGVAGIVLLEASTDAAGTPTDVRVVRGAPVLGPAAVEAVRQWRFDPPLETPRLVGVNVVPRAADPQAVAPLRVGGVIKPPTKITHVTPVYPAEARDARIQGVVIIETTIGADGAVLHGRVMRSVAGLDAAALEAVLQWEFTPTLMNGKPVPVIMTVTVNFTLQ
jgi:TonB family protein